MPDALRAALEEVRRTLSNLYHDPSPHAPEVPFELREALDALFRAAADADREDVL